MKKIILLLITLILFSVISGHATELTDWEQVDSIITEDITPNEEDIEYIPDTTIENFSDEQKQQYKYVRHRLNRIFEEELKMAYNPVNDLYNTFKGNKSEVQELTREEKAYISVVEHRSMGSSKIINEKLKELDEINNMETNMQKETNVKIKNKKAKKADLDLDDDE